MEDCFAAVFEIPNLANGRRTGGPTQEEHARPEIPCPGQGSSSPQQSVWMDGKSTRGDRQSGDVSNMSLGHFHLPPTHTKEEEEEEKKKGERHHRFVCVLHTTISGTNKQAFPNAQHWTSSFLPLS
ncbi:hypothetical protein OPV22_001152 [Ensete ventricosum]|uniref:Uncharacterized protein n=1 Tax=Ensete ventricosum TaxID=4639 RepID=A0AAV8RW25_ENSVE|nr:hypothetical protein OPV22_001152 [Ensete ventricosum]